MNKERLEEIKRDKALSNDDAVIKDSHYEWLIEQAERVSKQETRINNLMFDLAVSRARNKRYRELLLKIFKVTQNHQIEKISDYAFIRAGMLFYEWLGASGAIDLDRYCDEVNGHDDYDEYNIERMIDEMIKAHIKSGESK